MRVGVEIFFGLVANRHFVMLSAFLVKPQPPGRYANDRVRDRSVDGPARLMGESP
jgi:hypothetical protein